MLSRFSPAVLAGLVSLGFAVAPAPQPSPGGRVVAIGDIHGSLEGLTAILRTAGLLDANGRWSGGRARLVQTGDYLDRGDKVREVLDLLMRLESDASRAGGSAQILMGNHEVMNLLHDLRDVSPGAFAAFATPESENRRKRAYEEHVAVLERRGGAPPAEQRWMEAHPPGFIEYTEALAPRGRYGRWLRQRKVVVKDGGTVFMHAGLPPEFTGGIDDVNRTAAREIETWDRARVMFADAGLIRPFFTLRETLEAVGAEINRISLALKEKRPPGDHVNRQFVAHLQAVATIGRSSLLASEGPLWFRGFALLPEDEAPKIDALLEQVGASRFVSGHTPMLPGRITPRFNNRVFLIDTGMLASFYTGGQPSAIEIQGEKVTAIYTNARDVLVEAPHRGDRAQEADATRPTAPAAIGKN